MRWHSLWGLAAGLFLVVVAIAAAAPGSPTAVDLSRDAKLRVDGAGRGDHAGYAVAGAGDVNGDGRADVVIGADLADPGGASSGAAYVVFGPIDAGSVDLGALGQGGFRIDGAAAGDQAGGAVAGAGDVNGDGRDDVIVG